MIYRISPLFARRQKALELSGTPQEMFAIERLMREGVRGDTARDLVVSHGAERCLRYAEALDAQEGIRNRASFLVSAIRKGYALPGPPDASPGAGTRNLLEPPLIAQDGPRETEPHPPESPEGFPPPTPDPAAERLWARVLEDAEGEIDASSLRVWFGGRHRRGPGVRIPHDLGAHPLRQGVHRDALSGGARGRASAGALGGGFPARCRQRGRERRRGLEIDIIQCGEPGGKPFGRLPLPFLLFPVFWSSWLGTLPVSCSGSSTSIISRSTARTPLGSLRAVGRRIPSGPSRTFGGARIAREPCPYPVPYRHRERLSEGPTGPREEVLAPDRRPSPRMAGLPTP